MLRSRAEAVKVAIDQDVGVIAGSRLRYERRRKGDALEIRLGMVEVRTVMGRRWVGMSQEGLSVRRVPSSDLGSSEEGVRMSRVRAASIGAKIRPVRAHAAVDKSMVEVGAVEANIEASGIAEVVRGTRMSGSARPSRAAMKERKKVSSVRASTE